MTRGWTIGGSTTAIATRARVGFTLIELLVVIAIISLLIMILVPTLDQARHIAGQVVCTSNLRAIQQGLAVYAEDSGGIYPIEPTEHNPHPDLLALLGRGYAKGDLFYCTQQEFLEQAAQNPAFTPAGGQDSVIDTPENREAGNISYVYWSFRENKAHGGVTWRNPSDFRPRHLWVDRVISMNPALPAADVPPSQRWVMSDFFRQGAPFPHARGHARGLNVIFQDGHAEQITGRPRDSYR